LTSHRAPSLDPPLILTIDDELAITESLGYSLKAAGLRALAAHTLAQADEIFERLGEEIALVILDLSLPDGHGFDWLKRLRAVSGLPVMILSSHDDEVEHIVGLEIGADDYIDKPFSPREVVARVRAILRRTRNAPPSSNSQLNIDRTRYQAFVGERVLSLSHLEFELLAYLYEHIGVVFSRKTLIKAVWSDGVSVSERTVDAHIKSIRKALATVGLLSAIETVRGVGYKMIVPKHKEEP
jgi:two-component system, OmpR family, response regulator